MNPSRICTTTPCQSRSDAIFGLDYLLACFLNTHNIPDVLDRWDNILSTFSFEMTAADSGDDMKPRLPQFKFGAFNVTSQVGFKPIFRAWGLGEVGTEHSSSGILQYPSKFRSGQYQTSASWPCSGVANSICASLLRTIVCRDDRSLPYGSPGV